MQSRLKSRNGRYNVWMRGSGATLSGEKANDMHPDEPGGESRLMSPKPLMSVDLSGSFSAHDGQTPIEKCYR